MERELQIGEFYRHFKGNVYQIREIAKDSETLDKIVVYQGMYPPFLPERCHEVLPLKILSNYSPAVLYLLYAKIFL